MMHHLEVPLLHAGGEIKTDKTLAVQVVAGAMTAVVVAGGRLDGQIHEPERFIHRELRPHPRVAGGLGGVLEPRVVARLARLRNGVKDPQALAGARVVTADVALVVAERLRRAALAEGRADNHHVACYDRRPLKAHFARDKIGENGLIGFRLEINGAAVAERGDARAGLGVEGDEAIARRHVQNARGGAVRPIREAASRERAHRGRTARTFLLDVRPQFGAGGRIQRDDATTRAAGSVEHTADHQRRAFQFELRPRPERIGLEAPRHFERAEVAGVDLLQRRVA